MSRVCRASSSFHFRVGDDRLLNIKSKGLRQERSLPYDRSATEHYVVTLTLQGGIAVTQLMDQRKWAYINVHAPHLCVVIDSVRITTCLSTLPGDICVGQRRP